MERLKTYILCICAAAVLVGILTEFTNPKSGPGTLLRVISGIFLSLQLMSALTDVKPEYWTDYFDNLMRTGETFSSNGAADSSGQLEEIIKDRTRTYILDKAEIYQGNLSVEVELDDGEIPVPVSVSVTGNISPYGKKILQQIIATDLNIPKERQIWIGRQ